MMSSPSRVAKVPTTNATRMFWPSFIRLCHGRRIRNTNPDDDGNEHQFKVISRCIPHVLLDRRPGDRPETISLTSWVDGTAARSRYDDRNQSGDCHHSRDDVKRAAIGAGCLSHVGDQQRPDCAGNAPGRQHQTVDWTDVLRAKIVGGKRRHGTESTTVTHQNNERKNRHRRYDSDVGKKPEEKNL